MFPVNIGHSGRVLQLNSHSVTEEEDYIDPGGLYEKLFTPNSGSHFHLSLICRRKAKANSSVAPYQTQLKG